MDPLRFGIIGTGGRASSLMRTLMSDQQKRADIIALCDINKLHLDKFEKLASQYTGHAIKTYAAYQDLISNPDVDIVIIATPDYLHHPIAMAAFKAKKHVFLEKPVGINLDQMIEILTAAKQSGKILEVGYVLRYSPFYVEMKKMIGNNEIGRPLFVQALEEYYGAYHFYRGWWKSRSNTGGVMIQKICHDMDLHYWMFGRPKKIVAFESLMDFKPGGWDSDALNCSQCKNQCPYFTNPTGGRTNSDECVFNDPHDIADNCQILIQFENGLNLSMGMNFFNSHGQDDRHWRVVGSKAEITGRLSTGIIRFDARHDISPKSSVYYQCNDPNAGGHGGGDDVQMIAFLNALWEGKEAKAGLESAYWSSLMIMGAQISADKGKIVKFKDLIEKYPHP